MLNPKGTYVAHHTVPSYDCDRNNQMRLSGLLKFTQQVCGEHMEQYGLPYQRLYEEDMVFLVAKVFIRIQKMPLPGQRLTLRTCPLQAIGAQFLRVVLFESEEEELARVYTANLLIHPGSRKILRPSAFPYPLNTGTFTESMDIFKIIPPQSLNPTAPRPVRYSDIDLNGHMNNAVYADVAMDALAYPLCADRPVQAFALQYQNEALPGDTLTLQTGAYDADRHYISGVTERGRCFEAAVTF